MVSQLRGRVVTGYLAQVCQVAPLLAFVWLLGMSAIPANAQTYLQNIGVPPFTTKLPVENGFINAANGNLHLEIPLGSFQQRTGAPDKIVLMYDSAIWSYSSYGVGWYPDNITYTYSRSNGSWGGWRIVTSRDSGYTTYVEQDTGNCNGNPAWARFNPWIYVAPDGSQHTFPVGTVYPIGCVTGGTPNAAGYANDGSGFYISITNYTNAVVYAPDGTTITCPSDPTLPCAPTAHASEDANGNYVPSASYSFSNNVGTWTYTDTLGRTVLTEQNTSGSSVYTFNVQNAQGSQSTYVVTLQTINVDTNFGVPGEYEYSGSITAVSEIDLPDGTKYLFGYDSGTAPGYYGLLNSMILATGGRISYSFANFSDAYGNAYRGISGRTTPDGTWTYAPQILSSCLSSSYVNCQQKFTVTKPSTDQTIYTFALNGGAWPTTTQYYTGSSTLLSTVNQCWNFANTNSNGQCTYSPITASPTTNVQKVAASTTMPIPAGNVTATTEYQYDTYGNTTQISEWNFGNAPTNAADRTTSITYLNSAAYLPPNTNIVNRPTNITVKNSAGATVAQTLSTYDVYNYNGGSLASMTGLPGHDDTNYGTNNTTRGNVTLIQNLVAGSTYLNSYRNFDMTGQVTFAYDPNGQKTSNGYGCQNAYPTTITNPLNQPTVIGYDCNTGLLTSIKDPNNQTTSFSYDNMGRPLTASYPDGGQTTLAYNYSGSTLTGSTTTKKVTSTQNLVTTNNTDGLGRVTSSVTSSDPDGSTTVTTSFDTNGRVQSVSNPYRGTSNGSESYVYDGLDRVMQITHVDGHISSIYYGASVGSQSGAAATQLCASGTYGGGYPVLKIDEANNILQSWIDGLGRTIEADEPTATSGSLAANTCYGYDANNKLTGVLAAGGIQTRTYFYDGLSRLTEAINPETGGNATPTFYNYDADTNCASPNSFPDDLVSTVDPRGIRTCMQYDALHRLTAKIYMDGTPPATPAAYYYYDQSAPWGGQLTNYIGRLTTEGTNNGTSWVTASLYSYDPLGRMTLNQQCTPVNCGSSAWSLNYSYDYLGNMATYTNGAGVTITQSPFSGAGQLTQVTSSLSDSNHPGTLLTNVHYNALGEPTSATLGNGAVETLTYAPRGWPQTATVVSQATGTPGNGSVTINGSEQSRTGTSSGSQGPNSPSSASGWSNPNNVFALDGAFASVFLRTGQISAYLNVSGYGFNIPSNATISAITAVAYVKADSSFAISDNNVYLLKAGSQVGTDHANGVYWDTTTGAQTYGSSSDLWGTTWSPADINNSGFGIAYQAGNGGDGATAFVDYISITVYYTVPTTTYDSGSVSVTVNGTSTATASYTNGSTGSSIASQLASSISSFGFVTASASVNVISITSTTNGSNTNYSLSASSQSSNGFNPQSFTTSPSGSSLTGGTGAPGTLYSFSLGYGSGNANVTSANDSVNGNWVFTYDYLNRLSTSNQNNNQNACSYGYDQLGNRTSQTATAGSCNGNLSLSYSGHNNRMDGYSYDAAGNLLSDGLHNYAYDAENHLISVDNGTTASYVYDAEGRRVQKKTATQVEYLYDLNGNVITELSSTGAWNRGEIFANGQHLTTYNNGTTYFDHTDWLGTERARSSMADANCETITNLPFGDSQSASGACADANPLHFTGQQWDADSGLHYFGARHYSSQFGRFMSPDPTGIFLGNLNDPQSLNLYSYVRNNPANTTDPSGLHWECDWSCSDTFFDGFGVGWVWGGWGTATDSGPVGVSLNVKISPNGTLASDDPFGGETNGIPNGLRIPTLGLPSLLIPSASGCPYGGGNCGAMIYGLQEEEAEAAAQAAEDCLENVEACTEGLESSFESLVRQAKELYPKLAQIPNQLHHVIPKYLGGDPNGEVKFIPAAYHQFITNAFRELAPYGQQVERSAQELNDILQKVYSRFPLP